MLPGRRNKLYMDLSLWQAHHQAFSSDFWSLKVSIFLLTISHQEATPMPSNYLILCGPLLLLPPIPPSIRVFSNESALRIRWPKYWGFIFNISPSNKMIFQWTQDWSPLGWTGWISLQSKGLSRAFSNTTVWKHQFFSAQLSSQSNSHIHTWLLGKP